jgi:hypothetical protein
MLVEALLPCPWCLFQSIDAFQEHTDLLWVFFESLNLVYVDLFFEISIQECCNNINSVAFPVIEAGHGQQQPYCINISNICVSISVVKSIYLHITFDNVPSFEFNDFSVLVFLDLEYPLATKDFHLWSAVY